MEGSNGNHSIFLLGYAGNTIPQPQGLNLKIKYIIFMNFVWEVFNNSLHNNYVSRLLLSIFNVEFSMWNSGCEVRSTLWNFQLSNRGK
jgi:hypothetical protein